MVHKASHSNRNVTEEGWRGEGEEIVNIQPNLQTASFYFTREIPDPLRLISEAFNHFSDAFLFVFLNIFFYFLFLHIFLPIFPV